MPVVTIQDCAQCPVIRYCSAHNPSGEWDYGKGVDPCLIIVPDKPDQSHNYVIMRNMHEVSL